MYKEFIEFFFRELLYYIFVLILVNSIDNIIEFECLMVDIICFICLFVFVSVF